MKECLGTGEETQRVGRLDWPFSESLSLMPGRQPDSPGGLIPG